MHNHQPVSNKRQDANAQPANEAVAALDHPGWLNRYSGWFRRSIRFGTIPGEPWALICWPA